MNRSSASLELVDFLRAQEVIDRQTWAIVSFYADLADVLWVQVVV